MFKSPLRPVRTVLRAEVSAAKRTSKISHASPDDFATTASVAADAARLRREAAVPYCFDLLRGRSLYVCGPDKRQLMRAPFYYLHARRTAKSVFSVPWEIGPVYPAAHTGKAIFVFSPGRCGSTLLSRILCEADIPSLSEPDFYSQLLNCSAPAANAAFGGGLLRAVGNLTQDLIEAFAADDILAIKLRGGLCRIPERLLSSSGANGKTVFMLRDFEPWARSTLQSFNKSPRRVVAKYRQALNCLPILRRIGPCHVVHYESLLAEPLNCCRRLGAFLGRPIDPSAVRRAMMPDSQAETPMARGARPVPPDLHRRLDKTMRLWQAPGMDDLRAIADDALRTEPTADAGLSRC